MKRIGMIAFAAALLSPALVAAQTVNIDNFNTSETTLSRNTLGTSSVTHTTGAAIGGSRYVELTKSAPDNGDTVQLIWNGSDQTFGSTNSVGSFLLVWGQAAQLDADITGTNTFTFESVSLDFNSPYTITIISNQGEGGEVTATYNGNLPGANPNPYDISIQLSSFTNGGSLNLTDIDQISFAFSGPTAATDFGLDNIRFTFTAIPEPTTMALGGLICAGGVGYARWRRRKNLELADKVQETFNQD